LPSSLNQNLNSIFVIFGVLNQNNIFKSKYILEYHSENNFQKCLQFANSIGGLDIYVNSIQFNNNIQQLYDGNNNSLGLIYNLNYVPSPIQQNKIFNSIKSPTNNIPITNQLPNQNVPFTNQHQRMKSQGQIKIYRSIINDFPAPPLIGLKNVGATCYMNATLQCLSQIKKLTDYFKYHDYVNQVITKYKKEKKANNLNFANINNCKLIGLANIGATCYMNATLECFINIDPLTRYLLTESNYYQIINNTGAFELSSAYCDLLANVCLDESGISYFKPRIFKEVISWKNPIFEGVNANDSKDLIIANYNFFTF
jgi:hypothetical protein